MKSSKFLKFNTLLLMLAVSASLIFLTCGFLRRLPKGVTVNGIDVGGKSREEACEILRKDIVKNLKEKSLKIHGIKNEYIFTYPEINFKDNLPSLLSCAKRNGEYTASVSYYLNGISEISAYICEDESEEPTPPHAIFHAFGEPFEYVEGHDGYKADRVKLLSDIRASLSNNLEEVFVTVKPVKYSGTLEKVKRETKLLSAYTTYFDGTNTDRAHNIMLAAEQINGTVLLPGGAFSFNGTVGPRTSSRGFKSAKIIEKGEFVEGIGGGVCQVSTTMYVAAVLAGCEITEFHPHSLAVGYVPPSFDAMVSGNYFDLKFENKTKKTMYIRAYTGENYVKFVIFGEGDGASYELKSHISGSIAAPEELTEDETLVKDGRDGIISEGYLPVTRGGITRTVLLRKDKYAPLKRVVLNTAEEREEPLEEVQ